MADHVGITKTLCKVKGEVKYTSLDGASRFKTGNLELVVTATSQVVCVVNFNIGPSKKFMLTNQIKGYISNQQRCVINLKNGTNINYKNKNSENVKHFVQIIEELKQNRNDRRPTTSTVMGVQSSPQRQAYSPVRQSPGLWNSQNNNQRTRWASMTPKSSLQFTPEKSYTPRASQNPSSRTSPNPMMTPSHLRSSLRRPVSKDNGVIDIKDADELDSDGGKTEFSPLLFTDMPVGDKENVGTSELQVRKTIPKQSTSERGKSAYQMRQEEGGSLFMASFQEKQLQMEERKENTAPRSVSKVTSFYSRGRQAAGYTASDALLQPRQTNPNVTIKRTPSFLGMPNSKKSYPITNYIGWRQKNIPTAIKTSQISLQGFSNLGNTCYMNAILQSLFGLECFTVDMLNADIIPLMQKTSLYRALASLLFAKKSNYSAEKIGIYLRYVKQAISSTAARFSGFMQHDAQEFLCQCFDQLREDTEKANKRALDSPPSDVSWTEADGQDLKPPHPCPIVRNFEFEVRHSIVCKQCREVVTKVEQFYDLSLDMPQRSATSPTGSIQTALEQFFREEAIEYSCSECDCKQATVTHQFTKLPRVIIIHLKRYKFDTDAYQYAKLRRRILIPMYLSVYYHCTKDTQSPLSIPKSLINGTSSPRRLLNTERTQRAVFTGRTADENWPAKSQSFKPSRFSFNSSSRKKLDYDSSSEQTMQTILLDGNADSEGDETRKVLEMSKKEAERSQREARERKQLEEEELRKVLDESKHTVDSSKPITDMSEEQQLAYALAISSQETGNLNPHNGFDFPESGASQEVNPRNSHEIRNNIRVHDFVETPEDAEILECLKRRGSDDLSGSVDRIQQQGCGNGVHLDFRGNMTPWKRLKSDNQLSNQGSPSERTLCTGDSGIDLIDDAHKLESSRTPSHGPLHGLKKSFVRCFSPVKRTANDSALSLDHNQSDTPRSSVKYKLVESNSVDKSREQDHNTAQLGEDGEEKEKRSSYEELKAKEEEELRQATELSLRDAQEMEKQEEDALKRAKEISLQEFSESFNNSPDEQDDHEPMEIDEESDENVLYNELDENAETGNLSSSYRLVSVVSHMGSTSSVGHYISDVYDSKKNSWLSYDDSQVVRISESAVREERERTGYIFFYVAKS